MSDLLVASFSPAEKASAQHLFAAACQALERIKGVQLSDQAGSDGSLMARFASACSPTPGIARSPQQGSLVAAAGWCRVAGQPQADRPPLDVFGKEWGLGGDAKALDCLDGQYAAACADPGTQRVLAWVDRLGLLPAYIGSGEGVAWFSTSAMALASVLGSRLDLHSVRTLFLGASPKSPHSLFEGIHRLGYGQHVELLDGRCRVHRTWRPYRPVVRYRNLNEAIEDGVGRMRGCCESIRNTFALPIMDLTGGLDTRLVAAGMLRGEGDRLHVTVSGPPDNIDVRIAHQAARLFGWDMLPFAPSARWGDERWPLFQQGVALSDGELTGNRVDHVMAVKRVIRDAGGVAVTGGGGEMFRDFFWQQEFLRIGRTSHLDIARLIRYRFFFNGYFERALLGSDWHRDFLATEIDTIRQIADLEPDALNTAKLDAIYVWKTGGHVGRYGAASMPLAISISPLATRDLVEYAIGVPWRYRRRGRLVRGLITKMSPRLAKLPTTNGSSAEPLSLLSPLQLLKYGASSARTLVRKVSQLLTGRSLLRDPSASKYDPSPDIELARVLKDEGMLRPENLLSAGLYPPDGLADFLGRAARPDFTRHQQLQVLVSLELVCRLTAGRGAHH